MRTSIITQPLYCFIISAVFFLFANVALGQTLTSDKGDYAPGATVILTGSGFQAGETVRMQVQHYDVNGDNDTSDAHAPWDVMADGDGNFVTTWLIPADEDELGATLTATADGQSSGLHADVMFTDSQDQPPECIGIIFLGTDTTIIYPSDPVFTPPTAIDLCDSPVFVIVIADETVPGVPPILYSRTVCWVATDSSGNVSETICQTINVINAATTQTIAPVTSCVSYTLPWGQVVTTTDNYSHIYTSINGFDSTIIIPVTINPVYNITGSPVAACGSYALPWGVVATSSGDYSHTYSSVNGCDSTVMIHVAINSGYNLTGVPVTACVNYTLPWGVVATSSGDYGHTYSSVNGCDSTITIHVTINQIPNPVITGNNLVCTGSISTFDAGSGYSSYSWSTGATTQSISVNTAGAYTVTVTNSYGCTGSISRTLAVNANPVPVITGNTSICSGAVTVLSAGSGYASYLWSTGATTQTISVNTAGMYTVTVTNASGCTGNATTSVTTQTTPTATASSNSPVAGGSTLNLTSSGGTSYSWSGPNAFSSALQNPSISGITYQAAGTYTVVVSNSYGCTAIATTPVVTTCSGFKSYTFTQGGWGANPSGNNPAIYRNANFPYAFPAGLNVGCGSNWLYLTTSLAVQNFLPSSGTPGVLTQSYTNPGTSLSNSFAGQITALAMNIGFDNYDATFAPTSMQLKDLYIKTGTFTGWTVLQVLTEAQKKLGGCSSAYTASQLNNACANINENYDNGTTDKGYLSCMPLRIANEPSIPEVNNLKLYPNPTNGVFVIELNLDEAITTSMDIQILNQLGQIISANKTDAIGGILRQELNFDTNLPNGNYLIRVISGQRVFSEQVVYQK